MLILKETEAITKASEDFVYFLCKFVYTLDEHDENNPIKKFPMEKEYLKELAEIITKEKLLLIEKSRQMLVTWICIAYCLWMAMFHQGKRVFIQSKKEHDADELLNRAKFIYKHLPDLMKNQYKADEPMAYCVLRFGKLDSIIQATAQGADVLRQFTASLILSDEMAFQEKAEEAFIAAKPTITGGGQFIGVSSPNFKEFFYLLKSDKI